MNRNLPSLDLVRGFEAAARHLSFTKAAAELFLTQSAVSRQVLALEEQLGTPLFERRHRAIQLTAAGQELYRAASEALRVLGDSAARIRERNAARSVTVSCSIGFAALWLVPRLMDFREQHPDIDLRIDANNRLLDLERDRVEAAVRYCPPELAPPGATRLFGEQVIPVCSPALLARPERPLRVPADLRHHVLLQYEAAETVWPTGAWRVWLEVMQQHELRPAGTLEFNQYDQLINAAVEGQGVALGVSPLVQRHIRQGRLVALFDQPGQPDQRFSSPRGYYLLLGRFGADRPEVKALADWLLRTAERESAQQA
jgi:DNA-binding transcriptional LysR family regulator